MSDYDCSQRYILHDAPLLRKEIKELSRLIGLLIKELERIGENNGRRK